MKSVVALFVAAVVVQVLAGCASKQQAPVVDRTRQAPVAQTESKPVAAPAAERVAAKGGYIVKAGDTLYKISLDHGHGYKDVAAWNNLESPFLIHPGQELRVQPPDSEAQPVAVARPVVIATAVEQRPIDDAADALKREPRAGREPYSDEAYAKVMKGAADAPLPRVELTAAPKSASADARPDGDPQWAWPAPGKLLAQFGDNGKKGIEVSGRKGDPVLASADGKVVYSGSALRGYGQLLILKHNPDYLSVYAHNSRILVKEQDPVKRGQKIAEMGDTETDQVKLYFEIRQQGRQVDPSRYLPQR
jgi:lipoprotein NlpD